MQYVERFYSAIVMRSHHCLNINTCFAKFLCLEKFFSLLGAAVMIGFQGGYRWLCQRPGQLGDVAPELGLEVALATVGPAEHKGGSRMGNSLGWIRSRKNPDKDCN